MEITGAEEEGEEVSLVLQMELFQIICVNFTIPLSDLNYEIVNSKIGIQSERNNRKS